MADIKSAVFCRTDVAEMAALIERSLEVQSIDCPVRIHGDGDFWSFHYLAAWCQVAWNRPQQQFYCYSKSLIVVLQAFDMGLIPSNLIVTASIGGRYDHLIEERPDCFRKWAVVVSSEAEAESMGLSIDHDDSTPLSPQPGGFALLLHGTQPAGSPAAAALKALKAAGHTGYGRKTNQQPKVRVPKLLTAAQCAQQGVLYFSPPNAKVHGSVLFSLPAGHTCPGASECLSRADRVTGQITDGPTCKFRCFAASAESRSPDLRNAVWHNLDALLAASRSK